MGPSCQEGKAGRCPPGGSTGSSCRGGKVGLCPPGGSTGPSCRYGHSCESLQSQELWPITLLQVLQEAWVFQVGRVGFGSGTLDLGCPLFIYLSRSQVSNSSPGGQLCLLVFRFFSAPLVH